MDIEVNPYNMGKTVFTARLTGEDFVVTGVGTNRLNAVEDALHQYSVVQNKIKNCGNT